MQFITTGNRIAVENFTIGDLYTITFTNGNYINSACIGIGGNFVTFQRNEPELLFSLTMETAELVSTIDLYAGGSGTNNYNELTNKPQINSVELVGNKSLAALGIQPEITEESPLSSALVSGLGSAAAAESSDFATAAQGALAASAVQPAALDAALALKQDALSSAQLEAVNSGVTAADVSQITTNKNNISFLTVNGGGKNKLNLIISEIKSLNTSGTWAGDTYTRNGVDFTINSDLSITVNASSAATALATLELKINTPTFTTATTLSGCPSGGNYDSTYALYTTDSNGNTTARDTGSGVDITNKSIAKIRILVRGGYKPTNLIFKPMICDTAIYTSEKTYQPYAPSNRELYEMILALQ